MQTDTDTEGAGTSVTEHRGITLGTLGKANSDTHICTPGLQDDLNHDDDADDGHTA